MGELVVIAVFAAAGWFWYDSMRAREAAVRLGKQICQREAVQFLDDTVALAVLRVARNALGQVALRRTYRFEFSAAGSDRFSGNVVLLGNQLELFNLEPHQKGQAYATPSSAAGCCGGGCQSSAPACGDGRCD